MELQQVRANRTPNPLQFIEQMEDQRKNVTCLKDTELVSGRSWLVNSDLLTPRVRPLASYFQRKDIVNVMVYRWSVITIYWTKASFVLGAISKLTFSRKITSQIGTDESYEQHLLYARNEDKG